MSARWEEAYDAQLDIYRLWRSPFGQQEGEAWGKGAGDTFDGDFAEAMALAARQADPIYIDREMMPLIRAAIPGFEPEPLIPSDLPTLAGFLLLPEPILVDEIGGQIAVRAYLWSSDPFFTMAGPGVWVTTYKHRGDLDDWPELWHELPTGIGWHLSRVWPWVYGENYPEPGMREHAQVLQCILRLMAQTITVRSAARPSAPFRRRWEKADLPQRDVVVIRLRRPKAHPSGDHRDVDWTHRWIVGGHWRQQWYPSLGMHRQVWISPYVKGPESKPLVVRRLHAFEFVR